MIGRIRFYPKDKNKTETTLLASIHFRGSRYRIYTGERINTAFWMEDIQQVKRTKQYEDADYVNARIQLWQDTIQKALEYFSSDIDPPHADDFNKKVKEIKAGSIQKNEYMVPWAEDFADRSGKAHQTVKHYKTTIGILKGYETKFRTRIRFKDVDIQLYRSLKKHMEEKGYALNTFGSTIKHIKVFMNESQEEIEHGFSGHQHPKFSTPSETADAIYLSESELLKIHNMQLTWETIMDAFPKITSGNLKRKLQSYHAIRDRFLIGCFTALRVSDFTRLQRINVDSDFIRIKPQKGVAKNEDVVIPVHWVIKEIMARGFDWNKKVYDQKINQHIKHICRMAGIDEPVTITRTEGGRQVSKTFKKYELVTTHTARRSGATNMYKAGIPSLAIMKITGHRTEKSFLKYIKISQEENARMLKDHPFFRK